jgi:hypothetical protein
LSVGTILVVVVMMMVMMMMMTMMMMMMMMMCSPKAKVIGNKNQMEIDDDGFDVSNIKITNKRCWIIVILLRIAHGTSLYRSKKLSYNSSHMHHPS